jgi:hypothetical protein
VPEPRRLRRIVCARISLSGDLERQLVPRSEALARDLRDSEAWSVSCSRTVLLTSTCPRRSPHGRCESGVWARPPARTVESTPKPSAARTGTWVWRLSTMAATSSARSSSTSASAATLATFSVGGRLPPSGLGFLTRARRADRRRGTRSPCHRRRRRGFGRAEISTLRSVPVDRKAPSARVSTSPVAISAGPRPWAVGSTAIESSCHSGSAGRWNSSATVFLGCSATTRPCSTVDEPRLAARDRGHDRRGARCALRDPHRADPLSLDRRDAARGDLLRQPARWARHSRRLHAHGSSPVGHGGRRMVSRAVAPSSARNPALSVLSPLTPSGGVRTA